MALPKPKPPDDEIAELKQRMAALEASKPPNPKGAGRAEAKALAAAAMDECSRCSYRGPGRSRGGAAWRIFTPAGGSESHLERALVRPRLRREPVTMRAWLLVVSVQKIAPPRVEAAARKLEPTPARVQDTEEVRPRQKRRRPAAGST
jgi:hypothetical protein